MSCERDSRSRSPVGADHGQDDDGNFKRDQGHRREQTRGFGGLTSVRLYVGNLPFDFKWQDLKDTFRKEVGDVSYVEVFEDENGRPRGVGVVEVKNMDIAQMAIDKMHRFEVKGRKMVVKDDDEAKLMREFKFMFDRDFKLGQNRGNRGRQSDRGRPGNNRFNDRNNAGGGGGGIVGNTYGLSIPFLESLGINGPICRSVFVSNLSFKVSSEDLREAFAVAGRVLNAKVMFNEEGKSRGFGLIEFEHPVQAVQSISMLHNQMYFDRRITVRMDREPEKSAEPPASGGGGGGLPKGLSCLGMGLGNNGQPITDLKDIPSNSGGGGGGGGFGNQMPNNNAGFGGMDPATLVNTLMASNPSFTTNLMANMASMMGAAGANLNPNPAPAPFNNNMGGAVGGGVNPLPRNDFGGNNFQNGGNPGNMGPMGSTNTSFSNSRGQSQSSNQDRMSSVKLSNLPFDYTWQSLKDLCRSYGEIAFVDTPKNGVGIVRFTNETSARRAADMLDRQRFDGRVLSACIL